jgi:hypothetical protein
LREAIDFICFSRYAWHLNDCINAYIFCVALLQKALQGHVLMSARLEAIADALFAQQLPASWEVCMLCWTVLIRLCALAWSIINLLSLFLANTGGIIPLLETIGWLDGRMAASTGIYHGMEQVLNTSSRLPFARVHVSTSFPHSNASGTNTYA